MSTIAEPVAAEEEPAEGAEADEPARPERSSIVFRVAAAVAVLAAVVPIVVAVWRAVSEGWLPIGDNAYFTIRARDVFTDHHPLLGTWTSASQTLGVDVNNPGPLLFDLHAIPAKIDGDIGLAIGVALVNILCVAGIAWFAARVGGARAVVIAMIPAAGLAWTMGSELLFDPWQPHSLLFPCLFAFVAAWAACSGDLAALPWVAGLGSLLVQTHLTYAYLVPTLWLAVAVTVGVAAWRSTDGRRHLGRHLAVTAGVLVLCWVQPLIEQFTGEGKGNLSRLADAAGEGHGIGLGLGGRLVAAVVALPTWWSRDTFSGSLKYAAVRTIPGTKPALLGVPSGGDALAGLLAIGAGLLLCGAVALRWRDRSIGGAAIVGSAALLGGLLTAASTPMGVLGIAPHQLRWVWPVSLFVTFVFALTLARALPGPVAVVLGLGAVVALSIAAIPRAPAVSGPSLDANAIPVMKLLDPQLDALEGRGPVVIDVSNLRFAEPYSVAIQAELQRRGIEFRSDDEGIVRQLGESRRADGTEPTRLVLVEGPPASRPMHGAQRVAYASTLTHADRLELAELTDELEVIIADEGLPLSDLGEQAAAVGALEVDPDPDGGYRGAGPLLVYGQLVGMVQLGLVEPAPEHRAQFERWAQLRYQLERETVGLFAFDEDSGDG